ncbi:MAG: ParB/RepB/Spo0J family partition protein [Candidatus Hydrogenedentes bacterium]|nr:ParB/RepB/Spo0J family partition protein [Candidatus Hydrogenedentota bacterium]
MSLQTVSLSQLAPSKVNPRKLFDGAALEGLAASIRNDGLLQNLVVAPAKGKTYAIISGERRYRALKLLEERGELPEDFAVPVEVRGELSKDDRVRIAAVENLQRADLTPLEQTAALTKLVKGGERLEDVAAKTGLSAKTIKRRLALNALCKEAKAALEAHAISLAQAEALTLGSADAQSELLSAIKDGQIVHPAELRECLTEQRPCVADAIFPLERYSGRITTDLFAEGETSYFDDGEQFLALQKEAVSELTAHYGQTAAWVEVTEGWRIQRWQYEDAPEGETGGVIININPRGQVEIVTGLAHAVLEEETVEALAENPIAPPKVKPSTSATLRRIVAHCKSAAIGELLLAHPRKAKEVAAVRLLTRSRPHEAYPASEKQAERQTPFAVLDRQALLAAHRLNLEPEEGTFGWDILRRSEWEDTALYESVKSLSDHELEELHTLLLALSFGQRDCEKLDHQDSLFNRVAQDLKADLRNHWRPDRAFLTRRNREQLIEIAKENGMAEGRGGIGSYKKSELVEGILFHDSQARLASSPTPAQRKALDWLPEIMLFPALDPDARDGVPEANAFEAEADDGADDDEGEAPEDEVSEDAPLEDDPVREAA